MPHLQGCKLSWVVGAHGALLKLGLVRKWRGRTPVLR